MYHGFISNICHSERDFGELAPAFNTLPDSELYRVISDTMLKNGREHS